MPRKPKAAPAETPPVVTQDEAVVAAFVAGTLPEEDRREADRRAPEEIPEPPAAHVENGVVVEDEAVIEAPQERVAIPNDQINAVRDRGDGVKVDANNCILE